MMLCYASRTGTRRNLDALRAAGWRLLISRAGVWRDEGFAYAIDNGAWTDFQTQQPFDEKGFWRLLLTMGDRADWVAVPDIVAGGMASLDLSRSWLPRVLAHASHALIPVQDGMTPADLAPLVGQRVGIFLGGSTEWKLATMEEWGRFCAERVVHYHVARVNTARRFRLAHASGAWSVDGSSASRFAETLPALDRAARQPDMLRPVRAG